MLSNYFDTSSQANISNAFSSEQHHNLLPTTMVDEYDPLWLEFLQSLNTSDNNSNVQQNTTQSNAAFDSLFTEDDDDDDEFIGPDDANNFETADERKLRVSSMFYQNNLLRKIKRTKLLLFAFRT